MSGLYLYGSGWNFFYILWHLFFIFIEKEKWEKNDEKGQKTPYYNSRLLMIIKPAYGGKK